MGSNSSIEWTDHTWNPWRGCQHAVLADGQVHPGCEHCYAETMSGRNPRTLGRWGTAEEGGTRVMGAADYWRLPAKWNAAAKRAGKVARVFCLSLGDMFEDWKGPISNHEGERLGLEEDGSDWQMMSPGGHWHPGNVLSVSRPAKLDDLRAEVFKIIDQTPWLLWLVLTKRPGNVQRMWCSHANTDGRPPSQLNRANVMLGTSISDQRTADALIPELVKCRDLCGGLFVSAEPLLGAITLPLTPDPSPARGEGGLGIDWLIAGGESGPGARPCHPDWVRGLRDQCQAAGCAFFFKQWGEWRDGVKVGKGKAGAVLDGREWRELPGTSQPTGT